MNGRAGRGSGEGKPWLWAVGWLAIMAIDSIAMAGGGVATDGRSERVLFWLQLEAGKLEAAERNRDRGSAHFSSPPSLTATKPNMRFNRLALGAAAVLGLCSVPGEYHCAMSVMVLILSYSILSLGGTVCDGSRRDLLRWILFRFVIYLSLTTTTK